jgi:hypothetical protein
MASSMRVASSLSLKGFSKSRKRLFQRGDGKRHVAVAGQENDRQGRFALAQLVEAVQSAHAGHPHVEHQAAAHGLAPRSQEAFCRVEGGAGMPRDLSSQDRASRIASSSSTR